MLSMNPSAVNDNLLLHNSIYRALQTIAFASPATFDSTGEPATFSNVNTDTATIRVGSLANPQGLQNFWTGINTNTTIEHNLNRIPIGYYVVRKTHTCDIYDGTIPWTDTTITLQTTNSTADTILVIF